MLPEEDVVGVGPPVEENGFPNGMPPVQVFVSSLQLAPSGQFLSSKHKYSHELFIHREPVGQSLSSLHTYEHKLLVQAESLGQSLSFIQLIVTDGVPLELEEEISTGTPNLHV